MYHNTSYPICTLDVIIGGGKPDEDDLIDQILQNQPPDTMSLDELVKIFEDNPWINLCLANPNPIHVKMMLFGPAKTLKINPSFSSHQEKDLCDILREHLDAFS